MIEMVARGAGSSVESLPRSVGRRTKRRATDKFWTFLFFAIIVIWSIASDPRLVYRPSNHVKPKFDNSTKDNATSECVQPKLPKVQYDYATTTKATLFYASRVLGKYWLLDVFTCNAGSLDANYNSSGSIVIWAHIFVCAYLIIYVISSMGSDDMYWQYFSTSVVTLISISLLSREKFTIYYNYDTNTSAETSELMLDVLLWYIPEIILGIIVCTKMVTNGRYNKPRNDGVNNDEDDDNDDDDDNGNDNYSNTVRFSIFLCTSPYLILVHIIILFFIARLTFFNDDWGFQYNVIWDAKFSRVVTVSIQCYLVLIIYYFLLMVSSCFASTWYERGNDKKMYKNFLRALRTVLWYHFGTVCYHATLIFPRIHATFIMNEKEFRGDPKISAIYRFYLTHWKLPNLSPTLTAACGFSHSESTRELLRLFISDSPKSKQLQTFRNTHECSSVLLIVIYNLVLISLWSHGIPIDPDFTTVIWLSHLFVICITYVVTRFYDATTDVVWYLDDGNATIKF